MAELIDCFDEDGRYIGVRSREYAHENGLWHPASGIIIKKDDRILLPVRSSGKSIFPLAYDLSVAEHCRAGEGYREAALRGLKEEMGLDDTYYLKELYDLKVDAMDGFYRERVILKIFECFPGDDHITVNMNEIDHIEWVSDDELMEMLSKPDYKFAPWAEKAFGMYIKGL